MIIIIRKELFISNFFWLLIDYQLLVTTKLSGQLLLLEITFFQQQQLRNKDRRLPTRIHETHCKNDDTGPVTIQTSGKIMKMQTARMARDRCETSLWTRPTLPRPPRPEVQRQRRSLFEHYNAMENKTELKSRWCRKEFGSVKRDRRETGPFDVALGFSQCDFINVYCKFGKGRKQLPFTAMLLWGHFQDAKLHFLITPIKFTLHVFAKRIRCVRNRNQLSYTIRRDKNGMSHKAHAPVWWQDADSE